MAGTNISIAYSKLLDALELTQAHHDILVKRGFDAQQIKDLGFKSLPNSRKSMVYKLAKEVDFTGIPGFWRVDDKADWSLAGRSGLLIPVRDITGGIIGLKIRADSDIIAGKYTQLSSNPTEDKQGNKKYPNGTSASISIHYPLVSLPTKTIRITEGELKADLASLLSNVYTLSLPGVSMWRWAIEAVADMKPEKILLAFDSDKAEQYPSSVSQGGEPFQVAKCLAQLYLALKEKGYNVIIEDWATQYGKGIDNVLADGYDDKIKQLDDKSANEFVANALRNDMPLDWTYIIGIKRFINATTLQELDKEQFNDKFLANFKKGQPAEIALRHPAFPRSDSPIYSPGEPINIEKADMRYFNLWRQCQITPDEGDITPFMQHCIYILPDERERNIMLDWLAYNVQNAGQKIHWTILLQGIPGTGKSYFGEVMRHCLGEQNVSNPSNEAIHEAYTGWQKKCQLIVIEELMARGRLELMNKLKPMITQPIAVIREMYKPPYEQPNKFNLLLFTNHEDAIIIDETDRRYCVLYSPAKPQSEEYYENLWDWTDSYAGRILDFLQKRDLSAFKPFGHAPMTQGKQKLIAESAPPLLQWVRECIETLSWPFNNDVIGALHLRECLPRHLSHTSPNHIVRALRDCGAKPLRQIKLSTGNYVRLMSIRNHELIAQLSDEKLANEYEKFSLSAEPGDNNPIKEASPF